MCFKASSLKNFLFHLIPSCFASAPFPPLPPFKQLFCSWENTFYWRYTLTTFCLLTTACPPRSRRKTAWKVCHKGRKRIKSTPQAQWLTRALRLLCAWVESNCGADFLLLLLSSLFSGLQDPALQALPRSHPPLIKARSHRYISPHRQCLFSRCCQVPFFALISSLKLFFFNPRTPCLPSLSFFCEGCQPWQFVARRDLWEEKVGALLQRAAAWLHLTHTVTQNSPTNTRTHTHTQARWHAWLSCTSTGSAHLHSNPHSETWQTPWPCVCCVT